MARTASDDERTIGVMRTLLTDEERRERKRLRDKEYYEKNREKILPRRRFYSAKCREEIALGRLAKLSMAIKQEPMEEAL